MLRLLRRRLNVVGMRTRPNRAMFRSFSEKSGDSGPPRVPAPPLSSEVDKLPLNSVVESELSALKGLGASFRVLVSISGEDVVAVGEEDAEITVKLVVDGVNGRARLETGDSVVSTQLEGVLRASASAAVASLAEGSSPLGFGEELDVVRVADNKEVAGLKSALFVLRTARTQMESIVEKNSPSGSDLESIDGDENTALSLAVEYARKRAVQRRRWRMLQWLALGGFGLILFGAAGTVLLTLVQSDGEFALRTADDQHWARVEAALYRRSHPESSPDPELSLFTPKSGLPHRMPESAQEEAHHLYNKLHQDITALQKAMPEQTKTACANLVQRCYPSRSPYGCAQWSPSLLQICKDLS